MGYRARPSGRCLVDEIGKDMKEASGNFGSLVSMRTLSAAHDGWMKMQERNVQE